MRQAGQQARDEQRQFWQLALEAQGESGLSVAAFCRREGLSEAAYYYWRRKIEAVVGSPVPRPRHQVPGQAVGQEQYEAVGRQKPGNTASRPGRQVAGAGSFVEVVLPEDHGPVMELVLCSGNSLRIPGGVDSRALGNIISVLRQAGLC
jgi:hypothetical protein